MFKRYYRQKWCEEAYGFCKSITSKHLFSMTLKFINFPMKVSMFGHY